MGASVCLLWSFDECIDVTHLDLVLDYIAGGDLYAFINRHNGLSEFWLCPIGGLSQRNRRRKNDQTLDETAL